METSASVKCPKCGSEAARITVFGVPAKYIVGPLGIVLGIVYVVPALDALNDGGLVRIALAWLAPLGFGLFGAISLVEKPTWRCRRCGNKFKT